jgi:hypothetical protein
MSDNFITRQCSNDSNQILCTRADNSDFYSKSHHSNSPSWKRKNRNKNQNNFSPSLLSSSSNTQSQSRSSSISPPYHFAHNNSRRQSFHRTSPRRIGIDVYSDKSRSTSSSSTSEYQPTQKNKSRNNKLKKKDGEMTKQLKIINNNRNKSSSLDNDISICDDIPMKLLFKLIPIIIEKQKTN